MKIYELVMQDQQSVVFGARLAAATVFKARQAWEAAFKEKYPILDKIREIVDRENVYIISYQFIPIVSKGEI